MPNYRIPQYHRYHDSLVSEYFWQLENVMDVLRGRAQHQQRFKEAALSTAFSVMQNAGTIGSTVSAAGGVVLGFLGQHQEHKKAATLTPEYLSGQWEELKKIVESAAEKGVERYRYFLAKCSEDDAVELGRVSAQRLWEYIPRQKLTFTIENMLLGIFQGKSGRWQDDWRNTGLTESAEKKRQTAEGALKHAGIAYCDESHEWHYALHHRDKDASFPKYGFMILPEILAKTKILEKRYSVFIPSPDQKQELENIWSTPITESIAADNATLVASLTPEVADRLHQLEADWISFSEWQDTVEKRLEGLQTQIVSHEVAIVEVKQNIVVQHEHLSKLQRSVMDISESRRTTYIPKPYFQPRDNLWRTLEQLFSAENIISPIAIVGSGGMGKTSLISQWAEKQKFSGKYHSIRRMVMDNISIENSLTDLARDLYVTVERKKQEEWLLEVAQRLKAQSWLIIWDNVENYAAIETLLPYFIQKENTEVTQHLMITSRDTTCWKNSILVDTFSPEESVAYIEHQMKAAVNPWFKHQEAQKLANCFDHHPLALELAMATVCLYNRSLEQYLEDLESAGLITLKAPTKKLASQARINTDRLAALWKMGLKNLPTDAIRILQLMSFIDVDGVGRDLMLHYFANNQEQCDEALLALRQQALVKSVASNALEAWGTHRLLQEVVRNDFIEFLGIDQYNWQAFLNKSWDSINAVFPQQVNTTVDAPAIARGVGYGQKLLRLMQEISSPWPQEMQEKCLYPWRVMLLAKIGDGEINLARYRSAKNTLDAAWNLYQQLHSQNTNLTDDFKILGNLGLAHYLQGDYLLAIEKYTVSITLCKNALGENAKHPELAKALHNLGNVYNSQGNYPEALLLFSTSLDMKYALYGKSANHLEIANTLNSLGAIYDVQGQYPRAIDLYSASLKMYRSVYGEATNHPNIAVALNNLGAVYSTQGDYPEALQVFMESLAMKREIYGANTNHPLIVSALNNLGWIYNCLNNHSMALAKLEESLKMARAIYGEHAYHPDIAQALGNLGKTYRSQCDYSRAIAAYKDALRIYRKCYGESSNHSEIASTLNNMGNVYRAKADYLQAIAAYKNAVEIYRACYGVTSNHPAIVVALNNLAEVYFLQRDVFNTTALLEELLSIKSPIQEGPHTAKEITMAEQLCNLGSDYFQEGNYPEAIKAIQASLKIHHIIYGKPSNHPNILIVLNTLGHAYLAQKAVTDARQVFEEVLKTNRAISAQTKNRLALVDTLNILSVIYFSLHDYSQAINAYEEILTIYRTVYGNTADHPNITNVLNMLDHLRSTQDNHPKEVLEANEKNQVGCIACCQIVCSCPCVAVAGLLQYCGLFGGPANSTSPANTETKNPLTAALVCSAMER